MNNRAVMLLMMLINTVFAPAQNVFHGEIVSKKGDVGIADGYVLLIQNGKIFKTTSSDKKGNFSMNNVPSGNYIVEVTCLGYQTASDSLYITGTTERIFKP